MHLKQKIFVLITLMLATQQVAAAKKDNPTSKNKMESCSINSCPEKESMTATFNYGPTEQFADLRILRYQVPDFNKLTLKQKKFAYYLSQAALAGRDIFWDQNYRFNLTIRRTLEAIVLHYSGDRTSDHFKKFMTYTKRVWFSNGIHHHYSNDKILPEFDASYFQQLVQHTNAKANFPLKEGETKEQLVQRLTPIIFEPHIASKKVSLDSTHDMVLNSAVNFYHDVTQPEAIQFYQDLENKDPNPKKVSYGLNSRLVKEQGQVKEQVWRLGGIYTKAIEQIIHWLEKAKNVAESNLQRQSLQELLQYYRTGDLAAFDRYNILWVQDTAPDIDNTNGFIETYDDPLHRKGSWEAIVSVRDFDSTKKFGIISSEAAWFEQNSPIMQEHKRENVTGVTYKIINVITEAGASSPSTPIGINLPNAEWIREHHGSKSVSLGNIEEAYNQSSKLSGVTKEFYLPEYQDLLEKYDDIASRLATGLHEVIGHASGKIEPGVDSLTSTLKNYASALEEARADLVALYYIADPYLKKLGLVTDTEKVMQAEYLTYMTNGLFRQLVRIEPGKNVEEAHMRNRQMIAQWVFERGQKDNIISKKIVDDKTYFVIHDYQKLRGLFGQLLREVQRIKSQGDYEAGKHLIETYGVKVDPVLHKEVLERWKKLNVAPYSGFINPELKAVTNSKGHITQVKIEYPTDFTTQMLGYADRHSFLPDEN